MLMQALLHVSGRTLQMDNRSFRCAIGKSGFSESKKEGDGCTPLGVFSLRKCWYRADRVAAPETGLPLRAIKENDGWSDDPKASDYNRHVALPYTFSHEKLWRDEHVYDLIVPLGYNDDPVVPGKGSAIFMHVAHNDYRPTEGCVALALPDLLEVLKLCDSGTVIDIRKE
jgi:L,D-peptidoglycan transpeptidase YkuD (ErfK/YbiS/YcfS/YnhG family)